MIKWDKPEILNVEPDSVYSPEDYLEGAVERLQQLGEWHAVNEIVAAYGEGHGGDPLELLIALEEDDAGA